MDFNFENDVRLEDERVLLRPLLADDFENLWPIASGDDKLVQYSPKPIHTPELLSAYIEAALDEKKNKSRYTFIIFDKHAKAYAGSTSFLYISNYHGTLEIGATWLGKNFQKTGLNRHCKFLMLSYAFDTLGFEHVAFRTDERNTASRKAIEKIGGKLEGVLRRNILMSDGYRRNTVCYSILKYEWKEALAAGKWEPVSAK